MADIGIELEPFRAACGALVEGGWDTLRWEWDARLGAALAPFPSARRAAVPSLRLEHPETRVAPACPDTFERAR